jgi:hypothetical protein
MLVDFDGVICKNRVASNRIIQKASLYTWMKMNTDKTPPILMREAEDICGNLYKGFGHTVLGLKAIGINDVSLKEYNDYVYNNINYGELRTDLMDFSEIKSLSLFCVNNDIPIFLFTNAPKTWYCNILREHEDILENMTDIRDVIGVSDDDENHLKPYSVIYNAIENKFPTHKILFVDDSAMNFKSTLGSNNWTNIYYSPCNRKINNNTYMVDHLNVIQNIINYNDVE